MNASLKQPIVRIIYQSFSFRVVPNVFQLFHKRFGDSPLFSLRKLREKWDSPLTLSLEFLLERRRAPGIFCHLPWVYSFA